MARFAFQRSPSKAPFLALSILSILLSLAITGCAAHVLQVFTSQQQTNAWWLPVWPSHFDTRGLKTLIGTSVPIFVLNGIAVAVGLLAQPWTTYVSLTCTSLTTILALFALIFPAVINNAAPGRDSMQTWTCQWSSMEIERGQSAPNNFGPMCHESRFAYFTTIPVFVIQLLLLGFAVQSLLRKRGKVQHEEKGEELGSMTADTFDGLSQHSGKHSVHVSAGSPESSP